MEKETKRKKQKRLIKTVLIGIGIVGVSFLVIRAILQGKQKNKVGPQATNTFESLMTPIKATAEQSVEIPPIRAGGKLDSKEEARINNCNQLLKALWKSRHSNVRVYYDDEMYFNIKDFPFPPHLSQEDN